MVSLLAGTFPGLREIPAFLHGLEVPDTAVRRAKPGWNPIVVHMEAAGCGGPSSLCDFSVGMHGTGRVVRPQQSTHVALEEGIT